MHVAIPDLIRRLEIPQEKERAANELIAIGEEAFSALHADMFRPDRWCVSEIEFRILFSINFAKTFDLVKQLIMDQPNKGKVAFESIRWLKVPPADVVPLLQLGLESREMDVVATALTAIRDSLAWGVQSRSETILAFGSLNESLTDYLLHPDARLASRAMRSLAALKPPAQRLLVPLATALAKQVDDPPVDDIYPCSETGPYPLFELISTYGEELAVLEPELIAVLQRSPSKQSRCWAANALSKMGLPVGRRALPLIQEFTKTTKLSRSNDISSLPFDAIREIKLAIKKAGQNLEVDPYVLDLVQRIRQWSGTGPCPADKAKEELRQSRDPAVVGKVQHFLEQKLTKDQFEGACEILEQLIIGSADEKAKELLLKLFYDPKTPVTRRITLLHSLTSAKVRGAASGAIPLLSDRNNWVYATEYFTAVPDEEAADALGKFFLNKKMSFLDGGILVVNAIKANASPKMLKYAVKVLEQKRTDSSDEEHWPRITALEIIKACGDTKSFPLVIREMTDEPLDAGIAVLELFSDQLDERAFRAALTTVDLELKTSFEPKQERRRWRSLRSAWILFQRIGKDRSAEVLDLLKRITKPRVWNRIHGDDMAFFRKHYTGAVEFPPLPDPRPGDNLNR